MVIPMDMGQLIDRVRLWPRFTEEQKEIGVGALKASGERPDGRQVCRERDRAISQHHQNELLRR